MSNYFDDNDDESDEVAAKVVSLLDENAQLREQVARLQPPPNTPEDERRKIAAINGAKTPEALQRVLESEGMTYIDRGG